MFSIELIGIPGAGKSSLKTALLSDLKKKNRFRYMDTEDAFIYVYKQKMNRIYRMVSDSLPDYLIGKLIKKIINQSPLQIEFQNEFLALYGNSLNAFISSVEFKKMSYEDRKIVINGFLSVGSFYQSCSEYIIDKGITVFFDEGLIQKSMMFVSYAEDYRRNNDNVKKYIHHTPLPNLLIYLKTDLDICIQRMKSRPKGLTQRLMKADSDGVSRFIRNSAVHLSEVVELIKKKGITPVLEINNNDSLSEATKKLLTLIPKYSETNLSMK